MRIESHRDLSTDDYAVLRMVYDDGQATRHRLASRTMFSLVKTSKVLDGLLARGLISRTKKRQPRGGRPVYLYEMAPDFGLAFGLSIGADSIRIVAVNSRKTVIQERLYPYQLGEDPERHVDELSELITRSVHEFWADAFPDTHNRLTLGVSLPGLVDSAQGVWLQGLQLSGVEDVQMSRILGEKLRLPVLVEDEARSVACVEQIQGLGKGIAHFVLLYLGAGVGTGIVIDHRLYHGFHGVAGEIGHVPVHGNTYRCSCGNKGCLETVVSVPGILRLFRDRLKEGVNSNLQRAFSARDQGLSVERILAAARDGDKLTESTLFEVGGYLGEACSQAILLFNPQKVLITGEASIFRDYWKSPLNQVVNHSVLPKMLRGVAIEFCDYNPRQEAFGAALLAFRRYWITQMRSAAPRERTP
ncbi:ROK family protein [Candidatus Bipolaricaulota bacterium]|nr:ROK family protein [Candidatus Bipolaricaulota bacterium]